MIQLAQFKDRWWWGALFGHGNANPGCIKCEEFLNQLRNYNILKRDIVDICIKMILIRLSDLMFIYQLHSFSRGISSLSCRLSCLNS